MNIEVAASFYMLPSRGGNNLPPILMGPPR